MCKLKNSFTQIELRGGDRIQKLDQMKAFWIHRLDALKSPGLSDDTDLTCFL